MFRCLLVFSVGSAACFGQVPANPLTQFNEAVDALIRRVQPSVAQILVTGYGPKTDVDPRSTEVVIGRQRAIGSGFVIDSDGYIMTNAHVVSGAERIQVILPEKNSKGGEPTEAITTALSSKVTTVPAHLIGVARDLDIALLKVDGEAPPPLPLAAYRDLRQGELVFAFGSPEGLRNTVTHGVISSVARQSDPDSPQIAIQTDTPINPGNSGGPLVNVRGEVVGMDTFIISKSGGNEGLGFAIPSATLRVALRQLKQYGRLRRQEIGISIQTITPEMAAGLRLNQNYGVIIADTVARGPADLAGLKPGDVLLSVDGQPAENLPTVSYNFLLRDSTDKVHVEVLRGTEKRSFDVEAKEETHEIESVLALATPEKNMVPEIGILGVEIDRNLAPLLPDLKHAYGIITAAKTNIGPRDVPLQPGDVIVSLNDSPTMTLDSFRTALKRLSPTDPVVLQIERDGKLMYLAFSLGN